MMCIVALLISFVPSAIHAQVSSGDVLGTVTDTTGAVIVDAKVTIKNVATAATRTATTNAKGEYTFNALANGTYTLTVEMTGFKTFVQSGLPLSTGDRARFDAKLETGAVTETVQVTTTAAALQTASSEVSSTVEEKAVADLPMNGRSLESAIQIQPGLTTSTNGGTSNDRRPSFSISAASGGTNNEMIDGFDNNERNMGYDGIRPSVDSVQEIKVDTSSFSAEFGRATGAVVNIVTKGGSNTFHGSLYEFFRNDKLDTYSWGTTEKSKLRQNYYGGSVGGPVRIPWLYNGTDKTFFFFDWEQLQRIKGISASAISGPTKWELDNLKTTGNFSIEDLAGAYPIYWNVTDQNDKVTQTKIKPSSSDTSIKSIEEVYLSASQRTLAADHISPIMKNYFLLFPDPNKDCTATTAFGCQNYLSTPPESMKTTNMDIRIDHSFKGSNQIFGRWEYDPTTTIEPEEYPQITSGTFKGIYPGGNGSSAFAGPALSKTYGLQLDYVHIFNQNTLLDLKAAYTRINLQSQPFNYQTDAASVVSGGAWDKLDVGDVLPSIGGPFATWTALLGSSNSEPIVNVNNNFQYAGSVTYTHGSHSMKFGAGVIRRQINTWEDAIAGGFFFFGGTSNIGNPSDFSIMPYLDDRLNFMSGNPGKEIRSNNTYKSGFRVWEPSFYAVDNWRVNNKLTLNLGLRYDIYSPFQEGHGHYANFLPSCLNASATSALDTGLTCFINGDQSPTIGVKTDKKDLQPRVGFAYAYDDKTVIRGAYGIAYFTPDVGKASIGVGSPVSVMQNYNPQSSFNYSTDFPAVPYQLSSGALCTDGYLGCIAQGPAQPTTMSDTDIDAFPSNASITSVSSKDTSFKNGYAHMANLAVQRQIGASTVTVAYVGSFGRRLLRLANLAEADAPGSMATEVKAPYRYATQLPYVTTIASLANGSLSNYNSMQVIYSRRFAGINLNANYNWGHALNDQGSSANGYSFIPTEDPMKEYGGISAQRAAGSVGYEVPLGKNLKGVYGAVAKGWKMNVVGYYQTGAGMTVTGASHLAVSGVTTTRPNVVATTKVKHPTLTKYFNTAAYVMPTDYGVYGNERVNQLRGPNSRNLDFSLNKDFSIHERLKAEFRAECFNIGNFANYSNPTLTMASSDFGAISSVANESRQLQFALKIKF